MKAAIAETEPRPRGDGAPLVLTMLAMAAALVVAIAFLAGVEGGTEISLVALTIPAAAAVVLLAIRRPVWAMTTVVLLMAFSGAIETNYGIPSRPPIYILLAAIVTATLIAYLTTIRTERLAIWPGFIVLGAFLVYAAAHIPFAESWVVGGRGFLAGPSFVLVFFAVAYARWSEETRWRVFQSLIIVALIAGAYALFRVFAGPTDAEAAVPRLSAGLNGELALFASLPNRVQLGGFTAILTPILFAASLALRGRWRLISMAAFALTLVALFGSQVRIALISAAIGVAVVIVLFQAGRAFGPAKHGLVAVAVAGLLCAGALGYGLTIADDPAKEQRFSKILNPDSDYSFRQRVRKWGEAVDQINRDPFGQGLGTAGSTQRRYAAQIRLDNHYVDNSYLQLGIQLGYPGVLLLVLGCLLVLWMLAKRSVLTASTRRATLGIAGAGALVTWMFDLVGGNNLELWGAVVLWLFLGLAVGPLIQSNRPRMPGSRSATSDLLSERRSPAGAPGAGGNGRDAAVPAPVAFAPDPSGPARSA